MGVRQNRIALSAAEAVLAPYGFKCSVLARTKHPAILIEKDGVERKITFVGTPRTENVENWTRQAAQRVLRDWPVPVV